MLFSIVLTSHNQPKYLEEAIKSVFAQAYSKPFKLVIVDDSSIKSCLNIELPHRPEIGMIYVKNEINLGLQKSYNLGCFYSSECDWIIRLDGDDRLLPNTLQDLEDFLNEHDNRRLGFVYSDLRIMSTGQDRIYPEWNSGSIYDLQKIGHLQAVKKSVSEEIGHWDTSLRYSADTDFIIRLIEKGYQIKHIPKVLYLNRLHEEQYTQQFVKQGNDPNYWKNLIFKRSLLKRPDLWVESRQDLVMQTSGSALWRSEVEFIRDFVFDNDNLKKGNILDIGCSNKKKISYSIGVDLDRNGGKIPELVLDASMNIPFIDNFLDGIVASHVIEHIKDPVIAIENWLNKLRVGGVLMLIVPHRKYIPNIGTEGCDPTHVADYLPEDFKIKVVDNLKNCDLLSFDKINNNWSFDVFLRKNA